MNNDLLVEIIVESLKMQYVKVFERMQATWNEKCYYTTHGFDKNS